MTTITKAELKNYTFGPDVLVSRTWSTKPSAEDEAVTVNGEVSYSGCDLSMVLSWATSERVIARQRVERTLKTIPEKVTVPAAQAGKKEPKTLEDQVRDMSEEQFQEYMERLRRARQTDEAA